MIRSMTGFGRYEAVKDKMKIAVEMRAVNHRYLDISIKIPKKLSNFESAIRTILKEYVQRGKVDVFVTYEDFSKAGSALRYNEAVAEEYLKYMRHMADTFRLQDDVTVSVLSR